MSIEFLAPVVLAFCLSVSMTAFPSLARWIAPGLLLQLLLNPRLGSLSEIVGQVADEIVKLGPVRVLRWSAAAIFPVVYLLWTQFIKYVWMPLVFYENEFATIVNSML